MIAASLPPSSSNTGVSRAAAAAMTARPVTTPPVSEIRSTPGWVTNAWARSLPGPASTFTTPGGSAAASAPASCSAASGHVGGILTTAVLPAVRADVSFVIVSASGQLNGSTSAATPNGSRCRRGYADRGSSCSGASAASAIDPISAARPGPVLISKLASLRTFPCSRVYSRAPSRAASCSAAVVAADASAATRSATLSARHAGAARRAADTAASSWARSAAGAWPTISAGRAGLCIG